MQAMTEQVLMLRTRTSCLTEVIRRSEGFIQALMAGVAVLSRFQSNLRMDSNQANAVWGRQKGTEETHVGPNNIKHEVTYDTSTSIQKTRQKISVRSQANFLQV